MHERSASCTFGNPCVTVGMAGLKAICFCILARKRPFRIHYKQFTHYRAAPGTWLRMLTQLSGGQPLLSDC